MATQTGSIDFKATGGFKSYAQGQYTTKEQFESLGGRNLFVSSSTTDGYPNDNNVGAAYSIHAMTGNHEAYTLIQIEEGSDYTVQYWVRDSEYQGWVCVQLLGPTGLIVKKVYRGNPGVDYWTKTFTAPAGAVTALVSGRHLAKGYAYAQIKVERGSDATAWTVAPEDTVARFASVQTAIEQNADAITLRATREELDAVSDSIPGSLSELTNDLSMAWQGVSSTAASTNEKAVTCAGFSLVAGATVTVRFSTASTASAPTLNVNNTGAKAIVVAGSATSSTNQLLWAANAMITFNYDGTYWRVTSEPRAWYSTCATAAATAAKVATVNEAVICKGTTVTIQMTYANAVANPTLNVTSLGAKAIYVAGVRPTATSENNWTASSTVQFIFDGQYFRYDSDASAKAKAVEKSVDAIVSRGEQLVINGNGFMGDNTNFSSWSFDGAVANGSKGSFTRSTISSATLFSDEAFPVDPSLNYIVEFDVKCGTDTSRPAGAKLYAMLAFFDVDGKVINIFNVTWREGTTTTLARELKNGDTEVHLTSAANWVSTSADHQRALIFWNYTNSYGYTYPPQTYSRNYYGSLYTNDSSVNKATGVITLKAAWNNGTIPAGTPVSQGFSGNNYAYFWYIINQATFPTEWMHVTGRYEGTDTSGQGLMTKLWPGTAYCKVGFLWNYQASSSAMQQQLWVTNVSVKEDHSAYADAAASAAQQAAINAANSAIDTAVDSISIGGRNLLLASGSEWSNPSTTSAWKRYNVANPTLDAGVDYTVSFDAKTTNGTDVFYIGFAVGDGTQESLAEGVCPSTTYQRMSITGRTTKTTINSIIVSNAKAYGRGNSNNTTGTLYIKNFKLERGNKATDWTPAPEDMATQASLDAARSWYATCSTAGATAAKVATIDPVTTGFVLSKGTTVNVAFTNTNSAATSGLTLNVNSSGAKNIKYIYNNTVANLPAEGYILAGAMYQFVYDGTYWMCQSMNYNTNSNNYDRRLHNNYIYAAGAVASGALACGTASGYRQVAANAQFDLAYPILWAGGAWAAGSQYGNAYEAYPSTNPATTGAVTGIAVNKIVWLKGQVAGTTFTCATTNFLTCVVPEMPDEYFYIPLGIVASDATTKMYFSTSDKLYAFLDGAFQRVDLSATTRITSAEAEIDLLPDTIVAHADRVYATKTEVPLKASGSNTSVLADGAAPVPLDSLTIYGESVQNDTPTPSAPVPIVSVGAGTNLLTDTTVVDTSYYAKDDAGYYNINGISWAWSYEHSCVRATLPAGSYVVSLFLEEEETSTYSQSVIYNASGSALASDSLKNAGVVFYERIVLSSATTVGVAFKLNESGNRANIRIVDARMAALSMSYDAIDIRTHGVNLLTSTDDMSGNYKSNGPTYTFNGDTMTWTTTSTAWPFFGLTKDVIPFSVLSEADTMTLSIDLRCTSGGGQTYLQLCTVSSYTQPTPRVRFAGTSAITEGWNVIHPTSSWARYSYTVKTDLSTWSKEVAGEDNGIGIFANLYYNDTGTIEVRRPQLEIGSVYDRGWSSLGAGTVIDTGQIEDFSKDFVLAVEYVRKSASRHCFASAYSSSPSVGIELTAAGTIRFYSTSDSGSITDKVSGTAVTIGTRAKALLYWNATAGTFTSVHIHDGKYETETWTPNGTFTGKPSNTLLLGGDRRDASYAASTFVECTQASYLPYYEVTPPQGFEAMEFSIGENGITWDDRYEPFAGTIASINLNGHELRSLPDGTRDELTVDPDGHVTMTQRVGCIESVGSKISAASTVYTVNGLKCVGYTPDNYSVSSRVSYLAAMITTGTVQGPSTATTGNVYMNPANIMFMGDADDTAADIKSLFADATLTYPLAEPQTIDLGTIDMPALMSQCTIEVVAALTPTIDATWWNARGQEVWEESARLRSQIQIAADSIRSEVSETYVANDDLKDYIKQSVLTQTAEGIRGEITKAQSDASDALSQIDTLTTFAEVVQEGNESVLRLGSSASPITGRFSNEKLSFLYKEEGTEASEEVAYIAGSNGVGELHVTTAVVETEMRFGQWVWFVRKNGNLALRWAGGE